MHAWCNFPRTNSILASDQLPFVVRLVQQRVQGAESQSASANRRFAVIVNNYLKFLIYSNTFKATKIYDERKKNPPQIFVIVVENG